VIVCDPIQFRMTFISSVLYLVFFFIYILWRRLGGGGFCFLCADQPPPRTPSVIFYFSCLCGSFWIDSSSFCFLVCQLHWQTTWKHLHWRRFI